METGVLLEQLVEIAPYTGWVYPNETDIPWTVLIVVYPYLTGLVAGAFTVSSLYHVFGMQRFKPAARLALDLGFRHVRLPGRLLRDSADAGVLVRVPAAHRAAGAAAGRTARIVLSGVVPRGLRSVAASDGLRREM